MNTKIFVFGNEDLDLDSMPLKILPDLKKRFPAIDFEIKDPNEELDSGKELNILDTVKGIKSIMLFLDLESFAPFRQRLTMHDFDLYTHLALLKKTGRLGPIKIIGIPHDIPETEALDQVSAAINSI